MKSKIEFKYRWAIVVLCSLSMSCFSFTSQDLATQHDAYKEYFADQIDPKDYDFYFNTLYSSALFFVIFLDVYVGAMADKYGPGLLFIIQAFSIMSGQMIFFAGIRSKMFSLLYVGRFLIYSANSTTLVSNSIMTAQYFMQKEMGLATSVSTTTGVMGVAMNLTFAPRLTQAYGVLTTSFITLCLTMTAFTLIFIAYTINKRIDEAIRDNTQIKTVSNQNVKAQNFLQQVKSLPREYWFICNATFLSNVCGTMVGILGPAFLSETYHMDAKTAGSIASMLPVASVCVPLVGKLTDYFGKPIIFMIISGILSTIGCYGLTEWNPWVFYAIFGVSYAIRIAVTVPILTLVVPQSSRGKAYGIQRSLRDVSGFLFTLLCGYLHTWTGSYKSSLYIFSSIGIVVTTFAVLCQLELNKKESESKIRKTTRRNTLTQRKSSAALGDDQLKQLEEFAGKEQGKHENDHSFSSQSAQLQQSQRADSVKEESVKAK